MRIRDAGRIREHQQRAAVVGDRIMRRSYVGRTAGEGAEAAGRQAPGGGGGAWRSESSAVIVLGDGHARRRRHD